ncbi:hypothetical protein HYT92_01125 [Candidatus Pacearchaeota archaeon]|nr:hypothetical protein [Candidatus Pacearchaeota archaeon]
MKRNDFLFIFAVVVIFLALANIAIMLNKINITGHATGTGTANLTVGNWTAVNFTTSIVNWGSGVVQAGQLNATLDTLGQVANGNWTNVTSGLILENIGNVNVTIDIKTGKTAATFLGGTAPQYLLNFTNNETGSCYNQTNVALGSWTAVNTTDPGTRVCNNFTFYNSSDAMRIDIKIAVPYDSLTGALSDIITATATQT